MPSSGAHPFRSLPSCAAAALYRRDLFLCPGGFDKDFFAYSEDVDLGFRLNLLGYACFLLPEARVRHVGSASTARLSPFVLYHAHRNIVWCYVKNMPGWAFWLCLPNHLAAPHLLFEVALLLNRDASLDLVYFDQDSMDQAGVYCSPFFKPSRHNPRRLLFENYLTHSVIRRRLVEDLGGFEPIMDGAQDWDLFFKISETTSRIAHIPKILYTWRHIPGSAALGLSQKPCALEKQRLARQRHLARVKTAERAHHG